MAGVICRHLPREGSIHRRLLARWVLHRIHTTRMIHVRCPILHGVTIVPAPSSERPLRGSIRSARWERLSHGLYVPRESRQLPVDLAAWQLVLPPSACFTSLTAAEMRGWWRPWSIPHPVFVAVPYGAPHPQRRGLFVTRHPQAIDSEELDGIRVASAAETLLAAAGDLSLLDLVILGDSALHAEACTVEQLSSAAAQRRRGVPRLRAAIPLMDGRSESAWESVLRMLHSAADVEVEPQKKIYDQWGNFVARADLWVIGTRRIHEYDGETHRDREVHRADLGRERRLVEIDWQRIGFTKPQLLYEAGSIIAGMDRLLGRTWNPRRLARWHTLLDDSLFRPSGRAKVMRRRRRST
jgi:hypothetical protein